MPIKRSFAKGTDVSVTRTREEITRMLKDAGCSSLGVMEDSEQRIAVIGFVMNKIRVEMRIDLPDPKKWHSTRIDGEERRRWRCLLLVIKSKLVAVADGVAHFEQEWLPYMVTASGETVYERCKPVLEAAKTTGTLNAMLSLPPGSGEPE